MTVRHAVAALATSLCVTALTLSTPEDAAAHPRNVDQRAAVVDFFRALDAVHNDPGLIFLQIDEMARAPFKTAQTVDIYRIRRDGKTALITEQVAHGVRVSALRARAGRCQATRFMADVGEDVAEAVKATRNTNAHVIRVVPHGRAMTFGPDARRTCSGGMCQHALPQDTAAETMAPLFPLTPASPFADKTTGSADDRARGRRGSSEERPERAFADTGIPLFAPASDLCEGGALIDPRDR